MVPHSHIPPPALRPPEALKFMRCDTGAVITNANNFLVPFAHDQKLELEYNAHILSGVPETYLLVSDTLLPSYC